MKQLVFFLLALLSALPGFCQFNAFGLPVASDGNIVSSRGGKSGAPYQQPSILSTIVYDSVRVLSEINVPAIADAYPWISPDGLRLYFSQGAGPGASAQLMFTQRAATSSSFSAPAAIPPARPNVLSYWFSPDELEAYFSSGKNAYHVRRTSNTAALDSVSKVYLLSPDTTAQYTSLSLNQAQDQLFVFSYSSGYVGVQQYARLATDSFTYVRNLPRPAGYSISTAQLSKDGLTLFMGASTSLTRRAIHQMTRVTLADSFDISTFQKVIGINDSTRMNFMPSMSDSLDWVAFSRTNTTWEENDLYLARRDGAVTSVFNPELKPFTLSVFPNPSTGTFRLSSTRLGKVEAAVYSITGERVWYAPALELSNATSLDLSAQLKGIYLLRISEGKWVENRKLVIE